jgi:hypothetical protein
LVFGTFSIQRAARQMDISAFVPLQDLGFGRAARLEQPVLSPGQVTRSKEAKVAVARRLGFYLYWMWHRGWNYGLPQSFGLQAVVKTSFSATAEL